MYVNFSSALGCLTCQALFPSDAMLWFRHDSGLHQPRAARHARPRQPLPGLQPRVCAARRGGHGRAPRGGRAGGRGAGARGRALPVRRHDGGLRPRHGRHLAAAEAPHQAAGLPGDMTGVT